MVRFNFVCHGLMWFVEQDDKIQILLPEVNPHVYLQGPTHEGIGALIRLNRGEDFLLDGVSPGPAPVRNLVSPKHALLLNRRLVEPIPENARNRYLIPRPDRIRLFRATEVSEAIFGTTSAATALDQPLLSHDVVCFSYFNFTGPVTISLGSTVIATPEHPVATSWCLYNQPEMPEPLGHDISDMNRLVRLTETGEHPDYKLSLPSPADKAHDVAKLTGLSKTHLLNMLELNTPVNSPETDRVGCHGAFIVEPD